ncbi:cytoskeletal protein binding protein [Tulasnella sp. 424]|nr:cytoskeletal protein binding protein [Tulasnella sp. 424]KAG8979066.1 cytoskeletal protein binding protein [Tulasnella sp. 425]
MAEEIVLRDVMKAAYGYYATADDELTMEEDQLLYLLGNLDDDWAKVQVHVPLDALSEAEPAAGLVPSAYIEPAAPLYRAVALYDYEPNGEGEIRMKENEKLSVYLKEDEWILVKIDRKGTVSQPAIGYVPANYTEVLQPISSQSKDLPRRPNLEKPKPTNTRIWHDRSGQFKVEAQFLGIHDNKIRLHKANGVIIEVLGEKMSAEDMEFIKKLKTNPTSLISSSGSDDVPLGTLTNRASPQGPPSSSRPPAPLQRKSHVDWFEFFLSSGCDIDYCTRYASSFEREKLDEAILQNLKPDTLRGLGLREGDIIRVMKRIEQRGWKVAGPQAPFAPVPQNEGLIPTHTGINSFVPTRPGTVPATSLATAGATPSFLTSQPTGFANVGWGSGFGTQFGALDSGSNFLNAVSSQPTGMYAGPPNVNPPPNNNSPANIFAAMKAGSFTGSATPQSSDKHDALGPQPTGWNALSGGVQPQPTGFNPGFGVGLQPGATFGQQPGYQQPMQTGFGQPRSGRPPDNNSPANIFAAMKASSFANSAAPQYFDKYDALQPQPTGLNPAFGGGLQPGATFGQQPGFPPAQQAEATRAEATRKEQERAAAAATKAKHLADESRRKREQEAREAQERQEREEAEAREAEAQRHPANYIEEGEGDGEAPAQEVATQPNPNFFIVPYTTPKSPVTKLAPRLTTGSGKWVKFVTVVPGQHARFRIHDGTPPIYGGFSDVWRCDAKFSDGRVIAAAMKKFRAVRIARDADASTVINKLLKRLTKELDIWMALQHPRISPLLGFTLEDDLCIISPWYTNGNVTEYIDRHPEVDRIKLDNVLIDDAGNAVIIDFGLSAIVEDDPAWTTSLATTSSLQDAGNARWMAPELLMEEGCTRSPSTDVYSFGCVALQIYTGEIPFKDVPTFRIVHVLIKGQRPLAKREDTQLSSPSLDWFYDLLVSCWKENPTARPSMVDVESKLRMGVRSGGVCGV